MKIKMLRTAAAKYGCKLSEGQTGEVKKEIADQLIEAGIAVPADKGSARSKTTNESPAN